MDGIGNGEWGNHVTLQAAADLVYSSRVIIHFLLSIRNICLFPSVLSFGRDRIKLDIQSILLLRVKIPVMKLVNGFSDSCSMV